MISHWFGTCKTPNKFKTVGWIQKWAEKFLKNGGLAFIQTPHPSRCLWQKNQNNEIEMKRRFPFHQFGFTLIELLVVIAIIAILAALLLPVLSRAKQKAQRTDCLNDLGQVMIATHMYADDNGGHLPFPNAFHSDPIGPGWLYNGTNNLTVPETVETGQRS